MGLQGGAEVFSLDYAIFQDHSYKGLYGGMGAKDIHAHKGLKKSQKVRQTNKKLGGTMPESLPVPERSVKQVASAKKDFVQLPVQ